MSWLDNLKQFIWDLSLDSLNSGDGIELNEGSFWGTSEEDIIVFSQKLLYKNPYKSDINTYAGDDIIETIGVPSLSNFYLGEGDDGFISRDQIRYSKIEMGDGDDKAWIKESLFNDGSLYKTKIALGNGNDSILIDSYNLLKYLRYIVCRTT